MPRERRRLTIESTWSYSIDIAKLPLADAAGSLRFLRWTYADGFRLRGALDLLFSARIPLRECMNAIRFFISLKKNSFRLAEDISVSALLDRHRQNGVLHADRGSDVLMVE